jgi:shikimate kinase
VNWKPSAATVTGVKDAPPVSTTIENLNNDWAMIAMLKAIQKMAGLPITGKYDQATANVVDSKL